VLVRAPCEKQSWMRCPYPIQRLLHVNGHRISLKQTYRSRQKLFPPNPCTGTIVVWLGLQGF
jgi:hypothetical protein